MRLCLYDVQFPRYSEILRDIRRFFDLLHLAPIWGGLITGSIARSTKRRYLSYSETDFKVFRRPAGATRCTDGGEIWHVGGDRRSPPPYQIPPHRCNDKGIEPPKPKILQRFDQNVEYKRSQGRIPCAIYAQFAEFVPRFRTR